MAIFRNQLVNDGAKTTYSNGRTTAPKPAVSTTSKSATSSYVSSYKPNTGTTTYKNASTGQNYTAPKDAYISSKATPQQVKKVYQQYGIIPSNNGGGDNGRYRGGGSGGSGGSGGGDYSGSSYSSSEYNSAVQKQEDLLKTLEDLIAEQRKKAEEAYRAQYEEELANNKGLWRNNADQINLNRARAERLSRSQYGAESGANNTNMARIGANWASSHNENNRNLASNDSTALSNYNTNLADAYNTVASAYSNFIMPVRTNRINYLDELDYRRRANEQDYDYRKFLANVGLM